MIKGKALKRAMATNDFLRIAGDLPLLVDKTELINPQMAQEMLQKNKKNRPINWKKVEEYADIMVKGEWKLTPQGIILDPHGNILTGQKRLWAIVYSDTSVYMRISRGCPPESARMIDRGTPQTHRDLAARETDRKHSPTESSISRAVSILNNQNSPSVDNIADIMINKERIFQVVLKETKGTKKTKSVLMILGAICFLTDDLVKAKKLSADILELSNRLEERLSPSLPDKCWGRGVAFVLAMEHARKCVEKELDKL